MKINQWFLPVLFCFTGCLNNTTPGSSINPAKDAFGDVNHVVVVCQQELWDSPVGDSINYYFGSAYPILPQPEALFDLRHMTFSDLLGAPVRRELRNYLFVADLSNSDSSAVNLLNEIIGRDRLKEHLATSKISNLTTHDKWAKGQRLFYIVANNLTDLTTRIRTSFPAISQQIREHDQPRIKAAVFAAGKSQILSRQIEQRFQIKMDIPNDWKLASVKPRGYWLRKESEKSSSNIILGKVPYTSSGQFTQDGIKKIRDTLSRTFVRTDSPGDYMEINDRDLPMFIYQKTIDSNYGIEARGIWETKIEYMGGPFQTYLIQTPKKDSLLYLDIFIYAPEMEKRNLMQQLEEIVRTLHFPQ